MTFRQTIECGFTLKLVRDMITYSQRNIHSECTKLLIVRSSRSEVLCKKGALKKFTTFTGKHPWQSLSFNKVAGLRLATLLKKRPLVQVFSCEFCEIFKNTFFNRTTLVTASGLWCQGGPEPLHEKC